MALHDVYKRMNKRVYAIFRRVSIKARLRFVLAVVLALLLFALAVMLRSVVSSYEASIGFINMELVSSVSETLDNGLQSLESATKYPITWPNQLPTDTYTYLSDPEKFGRLILHKDLENQGRTIFDQDTRIRFLAVFDMQGFGTYVKNNRKYTFQVVPQQQPLEQQQRAQDIWFQDTLAAKGSALLFTYDQLSIDEAHLQDGADMLFVARAVMNVSPIRPVGVVLAALDMQSTMEMFRSMQAFDAQRIGFIASDRQVLFGDLEALDDKAFAAMAQDAGSERSISSFQIRRDGKRYLYHYMPMRDGNYCVLETPYALLLQGVFEDKLLLFLGLLLGFAGISFVMYQIIYSIRKPIRSLVSTCNTMVADGDFSIAVVDPYRDELSELMASFMALTDRINYLIHEVYEKQMELGQTQLQLLRSQVNPHFLYNTLETIRTKAYLSNQNDLSDMALYLANLLRYAVSSPEELVTVRQEVEKLQDYLKLQKLLYRDRFVVHVNIEPSILECRMQKLLLQPLVENAIHHGISRMESGGVIDVLGYWSDQTIHLSIADNGQGIDADSLDALRAYMDGQNARFTNIGLKNVHRRIQLYHGEAYGVTIVSQQDRGTMVSIRLPAEQIPNDGGTVDA